MQIRLGIVVLAVSDVKRSALFYRDAMRLHQTVDAPNYAEFTLDGGVRFGVYQREGFEKNTGATTASIPGGATAPSETYFYADDPQEVCARLQAAGAKVLSALAPRAWGDEAAYYADPDGHVLVIARPLTSAP